MAKLKISDYSSTSAGANLNTDINSIDIDEGCAPSGINNAIRTLMAQLKDFQTGVSGDSLTLGGALSGTSATFSGNVTASAISGASMTLSGDLTVDTNTLYVDSTNNRVGVGTSSPATKLHVAGDAIIKQGVGNTAIFSIAGNNNSAGSSAFDFIQGGDNHSYIVNRSNADISIFTNNTERMRIDSSGNVGIGTSSPAVKLDVVTASGAAYANIRRNSQSAGEVGLSLYGGTSGINWSLYQPTSSNDIRFYGNGADRFTINSSGNVGIGTSSPLAILDVASSTTACRIRNTTGSSAYILFQNSDSGTTTSDGLYVGLGAGEEGYMWNYENDSLLFGTNNTERMRIDSSGNVLVGQTTNPGYRLLVKQSGNTSLASIGVASVNSANDTYIGMGYDATSDTCRIVATYDTGGAFKPISFFTSDAERMRIDTSGDLLVGATSKHASAGAAKVYSSVSIAALSGYYCKAGQAATTFGNIFNLNFTTGTQLWIDLTNQGTITVSSDYRVKKNIESQTISALNRIAQIRPVTYEYADYKPFNWKADGVAREGFIAHELAEVIPSAVEGEKDAANQIQSLKLDALCSVMVKAIQEQQDIIKALETRIQTLENQ